MGYGFEECFPCYFGGRGSFLQLKENISEEDDYFNNIYNDNVKAHSICFGCMYKLSKSEMFFRAISAIDKDENNVKFDICSLCKRDKICITNITVCNTCKQQKTYQSNNDDDGYSEFNNEDYANDDDLDDFDEELTEDEEIDFYNSKNALCFRCIDKIQFNDYRTYPRNRDILRHYIKYVFVNYEDDFKCDKCNEFRWVRIEKVFTGDEEESN